LSQFINEGYAKALNILTTHKDALERLTQALLEFETIDGAEVDMLVNGAEVSEVAKIRANKAAANETAHRGGSAEMADKTISPLGTKPVAT